MTLKTHTIWIGLSLFFLIAQNNDLELDVINGVAIMSDTDNSKLSSVAYYQNIYFSSE